MQVIGPLHDFDRQAKLALGPGDELAGVSAVGPGELDARERLAQVPQQRPGPVTVLDALLDQVADRINDIPAAMPRRAPALAGRPPGSVQRRLDDLPFRVAHVRRVPRHPGTAADAAKTAPARHRRSTLTLRGP